MNENPICPYCGSTSAKVDGTAIYPHRDDLKAKIFYQCKPCDAYVGTHRKDGTPLGTLADANLRALRKRVHNRFDPKWQDGKMSRNAAYNWLSQKLKIPKSECHMAMFDANMCRKALEIL